MKAMVLKKAGTPLEEKDLSPPSPSSQQVLVKRDFLINDADKE